MIHVIRPVAVVADILLAAPQHLHRPAHVARDTRRQHHAVYLETTPEAAADELVMQDDLLGLQAERRELRDRAVGCLSAGPDLALGVAPVDRAVHRLEGRVREEGLMV